MSHHRESSDVHRLTREELIDRLAEAEAAIEALRQGTVSPGSDGLAPSASRIRVLVADDHQVVRQGLAALLNDEPDIDVVGEAADGQEAVELARHTRPDVILMDIAMPRLDGIAATQQVRAELPQTRVITLSMLDDDMARAMREAGAVAFVSKHDPFERVLEAVRCCHPPRSA